MKLTRDMVAQLRDEIENAIREVATEYGLEPSLGTLVFTDTNIRVPLELAIVTADGVAQSKEAHAFRCCACLYGLEAEDLGRWFTTSSGNTVQIVGLAKRSGKYPVIAKTADGRKFKFAADMVKWYLENSEAAAAK